MSTDGEAASPDARITAPSSPQPSGQSATSDAGCGLELLRERTAGSTLTPPLSGNHHFIVVERFVFPYEPGSCVA